MKKSKKFISALIVFLILAIVGLAIFNKWFDKGEESQTQTEKTELNETTDDLFDELN